MYFHFPLLHGCSFQLLVQDYISPWLLSDIYNMLVIVWWERKHAQTLLLWLGFKNIICRITTKELHSCCHEPFLVIVKIIIMDRLIINSFWNINCIITKTARNIWINEKCIQNFSIMENFIMLIIIKFFKSATMPRRNMEPFLNQQTFIFFYKFL